MKQSYFRARNAIGAVLTLFEKENAEAGVLHDVCDGSFCVVTGETTASYSVRLCLIHPSEATVESEVLDSDGKVYCTNPKYSGASALNHYVNGVDENIKCDMSLHVIAVYTVDGTEQKVDFNIPLTQTLRDNSHSYTHPKKREPGEKVRRYGDKPSSGPLVYTVTPEPDFIVSVLDREPSNTADVDYICHWGNPNGNYYKPYFGIPGKGEVKGPNNGEFLPDDKRLKAVCLLFPKVRTGGGDRSEIGGGMLVAGGGTEIVRWSGQQITEKMTAANGEPYETEAGDITVKTGMSKIYAEYEFLGAWRDGNLTIDNANGYIQHFDYELTLDLPYKIPNSEVPIVYKVIATSRKDAEYPPTALVDRTVKPIKVMFDCFGKGSMFLTPYGESAVEDLKKGDIIKTFTRYLKIHDVVITSRPLITVHTTDRSIALTPDHILFTENGKIHAADIKAGIKLKTQNGEETVIKISVDSGDAYTLVTDHMHEGEQHMVNGFLTER